VDGALKEIEALFPHWHMWRGVNGLLYARRPKTSPPWVVRAATVPGLLEAIRVREAGG
jgi:hypothetical protein